MAQTILNDITKIFLDEACQFQIIYNSLLTLKISGHTDLFLCITPKRPVAQTSLPGGVVGNSSFPIVFIISLAF